MQIQKEEIKRDILAAAEHDFLIHGYKNASLRTVAKKANTTLGNVYNYFPNKEAILDAIVGDAPALLKNFTNHETIDLENFDPSQINVETLGQLIDEILPQLVDIDLLLSNVVVILLEGCEDTKYESFKAIIYDHFLGHMEDHLRQDPDQLFTDTLVQMFISSIVYIAKCSSSYSEKKAALLKYFRFLFYGLFFGTDFSIIPTKT